jgi:hypothetical protein
MPACTIYNGYWQDNIVVHIHRTDKSRRRAEFTIVFYGGAHITVRARDLYNYRVIRRAFEDAYPGHELCLSDGKAWRQMLAQPHLQLDGGSDAR